MGRVDAASGSPDHRSSPRSLMQGASWLQGRTPSSSSSRSAWWQASPAADDGEGLCLLGGVQREARSSRPSSSGWAREPCSRLRPAIVTDVLMPTVAWRGAMRADEAGTDWGRQQPACGRCF